MNIAKYGHLHKQTKLKQVHAPPTYAF